MPREFMENFLNDESGATAIEYGLIAGLVSISAVGSLSLLGQTTKDLFGLIATGVADSAPQP